MKIGWIFEPNWHWEGREQDPLWEWKKDWENQCIGFPSEKHPGCFGFKRKHHYHEGIDFYVPLGHRIYSGWDGQIVSVFQLTGAAVGSDWWEDSWACMIQSDSYYWMLGELSFETIIVHPGENIRKGQFIGCVGKVLKKDKGRPQTMLHLQCHTLNSQQDDWAALWSDYKQKPNGLIDPTVCLMQSWEKWRADESENTKKVE